MSPDRVELRVEVPADELAVLDGVCQATGHHRTDVFREILAAWSASKLHEATVICRVAGVDPRAPDHHRA